MCPIDVSAALEKGPVGEAGKPSSALASLEIWLNRGMEPARAKALGNIHDL